MTHMRTYRLELQYDGGTLHGWAKQDGLRTVEGCLEEALATIVGEAPKLRVAGRTDAGVHARLQVVSLTLPAELDRRRLLASLNALTPPEIVVLRVDAVADGFDARRDAKGRSYRYHIARGESVSPFHRHYAWWIPMALDLGAMREAAGLVIGRHDFTAFTPTVTEHMYFERVVSRCEWVAQEDGLLVLDIEADSFLRHMVRVLVGTMVDVGRGRRTLDGFGSLLNGGARDEAGLTAPARGLFLWDIMY